MSLPRETIATALRASYLSQEEADDLLLVAAPDGWFLVEDWSTDDTRLYRSGRSDTIPQAIIIFRGSVTATDWLVDDVAIATGFHSLSGRLRTARSIVSKARVEFGNPLALVGHSLGGWLAENAAAPDDLVYTADKAVGLGGVWARRGERQTDYRARGDLVSILGATQSGGRAVEFVAGEPRRCGPPPDSATILESAQDLVRRVVDSGGSVGTVLRDLVKDAVKAHSVDEAAKFIGGRN